MTVVGDRGWVHTGALAASLSSSSSSSSSSPSTPRTAHAVVVVSRAWSWLVVLVLVAREQDEEEEKENSANALRSFKLRSNIARLVTLAKKHLKSQLYLGVHFTYNRIQEKFKIHNYCTQYATAANPPLHGR